ncbi:MAG: LysR substrate-binding domain-containing protein [Limnothrix sp.]
METNVELRQLRYFVAVAEELNFTRAAERLNITQSLLSRQIKSLEKNLGIELLERTNRQFFLTPAGKVFWGECKNILQGIEQSIQLTKRVALGEIGRLRIGFENVASRKMILKIVRQFHHDFPGVELELQEMSSGKQVAALKRKHLEVGLIDPIVATAEIACTSLVKESLVAVLPETHPLAEMEQIQLAELAVDLWVVGRNDGNCGLSKRTLAACADAGFYPQIRQQANDIPMMLSFIASDFGVSLLPISACNLARPGIRFVPLSEPVPEAELAIARLAETTSPIIDSLLQTMLML